MSLSTSTTITCPYCATAQDVGFYETINVTIHPDMKAAVLNGTINAPACHRCGEDMNIRAGFLYHDMEKQLVIAFCPGTPDVHGKKREEFREFLDQGYIVRCTNDFFTVREKIQLFDAGLNDLVIDELKSRMTSGFDEVLEEESGQPMTLYVYFHEYIKNIFKKELVFIAFTNPRQLMKLSRPLKAMSEEERRQLFDLKVLRGTID